MIYELRNHQLKVLFTSLGASLHSIKDNQEMEYLWQGNEEYWSGQAPVLFPICGSLRDDKAQLENGKTTAMPRHGIVRKKEFKLENMTDSSICFSIESNADSLKQYPFSFKLYITYTLEGNSIITSYLIENHSDEVMPCFIGGHPGFNCPLRKEEVFSDYQVEFENADTLKLHYDLFAKDAMLFDDIQSRKVRMVHKETKKGIEVSFEDFPYLILWTTENQGPFLAIEPWSGQSTCSDEDDIFEHKRNVMKLDPGTGKSLSFKIRVIN